MLKHLLARSQFSNSLVVLFVLAFSISLAASSVSVIFPDNAKLLLTVSIFGVVAAFVYLLAGPASTRKQKRVFEAVLVQDKSGNLVSIPRYAFSGDLQRYISAVTSENKAIAGQWGDGKLFDHDSFDGAAREFRKTSAGNLAADAISYFLIERLSTLLTDYFDGEGYQSSKEIKEITRKDIPNFLLENKVLDILSKPIEDRDAFLEHSEDRITVKSDGQLIAAHAANGAYFSRFDLTIPADAKIIRGINGGFIIHSRRFRLEMRPKLSGFATNLPLGFPALYLHLDPLDTRTYKVDLEAEVEFSALHLFGGRSRILHGWVDSFLENLERNFDFDRFKDEINWETALSVATIMRKRPAKRPAVEVEEKLE